MVDEALPVVGPLKEIVDLSLKSGSPRYFPVLPRGVPGGFAPFRWALEEKGGGVQALATRRFRYWKLS